MATVLPLPRARRALRVRLTIKWTWNRRVTRLSRARIGSFPGDTHLMVRCSGRGPRRRTRSATGHRGIRRLLAALRGQHYRAGDRLVISLTARGYRPERARLTIRDGRLPRVQLLAE